MAAKPHAAAATTAEEQDLRQCIYEAEWQVSQAAAAGSGSLRRHLPWHCLAWTASSMPATTATQAVSMRHSSGAGAAAAAAQATLRQARVLQHIMAAPGVHARCQVLR